MGEQQCASDRCTRESVWREQGRIARDEDLDDSPKTDLVGIIMHWQQERFLDCSCS